ncbi:MAG: PAS domain-containing protein [Myxococcota bacterium]
MSLDFGALFDRSPNAYMVVDRDLRYVAANAAYLRVTGATLDALLGQPLFDVFPNDPDDPANASRRMIHASFERVLATGETDHVAAIAYRVPIERDGVWIETERWWSATHVPIPGPDGAVAFVLQHTVEVTDLIAASRIDPREAGVIGRAKGVQDAFDSLDAEHQQLRRLFEQAPGFACVLLGPDHVFASANRSYRQLVGGRDVIGQPVRLAIPEAEAQGFVALLDAVYRSGDAYVGRSSRLTLARDGGALEEVYLDFVYQPVRDPDGRVVGIFVEGHDVTDSKRLAAELEVLLEAIPQQVWTARPDGRLDFVNDRVGAYFGVPRDRLLGDGWIDRVDPAQVREVTDRWAASLATGDAYEVEFRLRRADGVYRWHLARAVPVRDPDGRVTKWFGTNTDVHDAREQRDELARRSEYEQQLIGIVSHDLRSPLQAVRVASSLLLKRGNLDDQQGKAIARIVTSAERATRLIADLLDFAEARSSGRIPIRPGRVDLRDVTRQVVDEVMLAHPDRTVELDHDGDVVGAWDGDRIAQVIGNLVANAVQHGSADHPVAVRSRAEGDRVVLDVHNHGAPIATADLGRLFEPYQRGGGAGRITGVGLGLYIAREIVDAHGGRIGVRSAASAGTTFTVVLPRSAPA